MRLRNTQGRCASTRRSERPSVPDIAARADRSTAPASNEHAPRHRVAHRRAGAQQRGRGPSPKPTTRRAPATPAARHDPSGANDGTAREPVGLDGRAGRHGGVPDMPRRAAPAVVNGNAPWLWGARWSGGGADSRASFGVVGQRNAPVPAVHDAADRRSAAGGGDLVARPDGRPAHQWQLNLGAEQTLWRNDGPTLDLLGDAFLPLPGLARAPRTAMRRRQPRRAVSGGPRPLLTGLLRRIPVAEPDLDAERRQAVLQRLQPRVVGVCRVPSRSSRRTHS